MKINFHMIESSNLTIESSQISSSFSVHNKDFIKSRPFLYKRLLCIALIAWQWPSTTKIHTHSIIFISSSQIQIVSIKCLA